MINRITRLACIGEAMLELSMKDDTRADLGVAGDTLNTAIYLRRTAPSLQVEYMTCLGDDPFSNRVDAFIRANGVSTAPTTRLAGYSPGLYAISTSPLGERNFTYWRSNSAARQLFADGDFSILANYDAIYLTGISLAILPHQIRLGLISWLGQHRLQVIYDGNFRPHLWDSLEHAREVNLAMWQRADIALPSVDDETLLFDETKAEVIKRFVTRSALGALKCGAAGPISIGSQVDQHYPPAQQVIDTTAAGDSFNGGYLGNLLTGGTQAQALMAGHELAARVVGFRGAIIPP